eukprot:TRINITY_DN33773_c0_g1_i1.p1 TRINITY_DN33773_c0_g1~~TRINITY_DN33773_c0_g1_i1.p1  ORF type:complete len:271 (-),score=59.03 TRINITY_DN33773_c0_g1_i1:160-972(-)
MKQDVYALQRIRSLPGGQSLEGSWAIDIGANLGLITIQLLKRHSSLRVLAVEPSPSVFRYLLWNLRENGVADRCVALNVGIGEADDNIGTIFDHSQIPLLSSFDLAQGKEIAEDWGMWMQNEYPRQFRVHVWPLEEAFRQAEVHGLKSWSQVIFVKTDCEGCEWHLFRKSQELQRRVAETKASLLRQDEAAGTPLLLGSELHRPTPPEVSSGHASLSAQDWLALNEFFCGDAVVDTSVDSAAAAVPDLEGQESLGSWGDVRRCIWPRQFS